MYLKKFNIYLRGYFGFMAFQTFICVEIYFKIKTGPFIPFFYLVYLIFHAYNENKVHAFTFQNKIKFAKLSFT